MPPLVNTNLVTAPGGSLTPDTSGLAQLIGNAIQKKQANDREDARLKQIEEAKKVQQVSKANAAQLLRVRDIKDFQNQRKELAKLGQAEIAAGRDPSLFVEALNANTPDDLNLAITRAATAQGNADKLIEAGLKGEEARDVPAEQVAFESLTKDLPEDKKKQAVLIKLGLEPRAVGSAIQTISEKGIEEEIGSASAVIKQREKFGEMTGSSRAKTIDKGFEQVNRISQGINTIDRAISALEGGAKTGALEKFLPSMRSASVELENIRNQFALDVIGGVTLGAISESELELAKQVGLPTGLDEPQLIEHLRARRQAQEKLRNYYQEQIDHLDRGGTIASFLREKNRQVDGGQETQAQQQPVQLQEGATATNPQTGQKVVFTNGEWQPAP